MARPKHLRNTKLNCEYFKEKNGYISGCGFRAAWNRFWIVCPYCAKSIHIINRKAEEE